MGLAYDQFAQELQSLQRKYADRPRDELIALCLMALEREELVTVGYREEFMNQRLVRMPLREPVRELLRHALNCARRHEAMHTIYTRHELLNAGTALWSRTTFNN